MNQSEMSSAYRRYLRTRAREEGAPLEVVDARAEARRAPEEAGLMTNCTCWCLATARDAGDEPGA